MALSMRCKPIDRRAEKHVSLRVLREVTNSMHDSEHPLVRSCCHKEDNVSLAADCTVLFLMQFVAAYLSLNALDSHAAAYTLRTVIQFDHKVERPALCSPLFQKPSTECESDDAWTQRTMAVGHDDYVDDVCMFAMSARCKRRARHDFGQNERQASQHCPDHGRRSWICRSGLLRARR